MAKEKVSRAETVEYVAKLLKAEAGIAYAEVVKAAKAAGYHVYPLIMGLAKTKLGLGRPKQAKRGPGRKPGRPAGTGARRGRPAMGGRGFTGELLRSLDRMQADAAAMRNALRDISKLAARF